MKSKIKKIYPVVLTVIITALLTFVLATVYYSSSMAKIDVVDSVLKAKFFGNYDRDKAMEYAVKVYVASLDDPYTEYFTSDEYKEFYSQITGEFSGIGVTVQNEAEKDVILVVDVFEDSPAMEAGVQSGDIITKVNGVAYTGSQLTEATNFLKGQEGTPVNVTILKADTGTEEELQIVRRQLIAKTVDSEIMDGNIGYISISQFGTSTAKEFVETLDKMIEVGISGLVVDLRNNTGGETSAVEAVSDCLLPKGAVIYYTSDKAGDKKYFTSKMDGTDIPLAVLSNQYSASASEIFIGAIKDNKRGTIVGTKSYGKGVVQEIIPLSDGSAVKVTTERYYTPNGNFIHEKGIEPDVTVELAEGRDNQLEKAIEILKNQ